MRHGIPHVAIEHFLEQRLLGRVGRSASKGMAVERWEELADLMFEIGLTSGLLAGRKGNEIVTRGISNRKHIIDDRAY